MGPEDEDSLAEAATSPCSMGTGMARADRCDAMAVPADTLMHSLYLPLGTYRFALHMHTGRSGHSFLLRNSWRLSIVYLHVPMYVYTPISYCLRRQLPGPGHQSCLYTYALGHA